MEKKQASNGKIKMFFKKNVYYIIMAICLLAIAAMITVAVLTRNKPAADPGVNVGPSDNVVDDTPTNVTPTNNDEPTLDPINDPTDTTPVAVVFASPVGDDNVICDYCMDSLVWHKTLKQYSVHNGIDFGGNDGDNVYSAYSGVVTDVNYDVLHGYTVKIKHTDKLTTTYSSLNEPTVVIGQTVSKGEKIGTMGTTATNEYLDGAHVHFSLYEDGVIADPNVYLPTGNK